MKTTVDSILGYEPKGVIQHWQNEWIEAVALFSSIFRLLSPNESQMKWLKSMPKTALFKFTWATP